MTKERWKALTLDDNLKLTKQEILEGWHFCEECEWPQRNGLFVSTITKLSSASNIILSSSDMWNLGSRSSLSKSSFNTFSFVPTTKKVIEAFRDVIGWLLGAKPAKPLCMFACIVVICCSSVSAFSLNCCAFNSASAAPFSAVAVPYSENGKHRISPAMPTIKAISQPRFHFFRSDSGGTRSLVFSLNNHFATTSCSPPNDNNTAQLNPISNQPQAGIELKKDIGFWIFAAFCWSISITLFLIVIMELFSIINNKKR